MQAERCRETKVFGEAQHGRAREAGFRFAAEVAPAGAGAFALLAIGDALGGQETRAVDAVPLVGSAEPKAAVMVFGQLERRICRTRLRRRQVKNLDGFGRMAYNVRLHGPTIIQGGDGGGAAEVVHV